MPILPLHWPAVLMAGLSLHALASQPVIPSSTPETLNNAQGENARWSGIGRLSLPDSTQCIGTLVDSRDPSTPSSGPAYVITSGHCVDQRNGTIVQDKALEGSISFNYFVDTAAKRKTFPFKRIVWSSMQGSDLALIELDARLQQVMAEGIQPLRLGPSPATGSHVQVIGEPSHPDQGLRLSSCTEQAVEVVIEYPWVWRNARSNDCPGMHEGASGSPVIDSSNGQVVSVVNSGRQNRSDSLPCSLHNPCADHQDDQLGNGPVNFAMPVERVKACFRAGQVDLEQQNCDLLPGFELKQDKPGSRWRRLATNDDGTTLSPTWGVGFTIDTRYYRYKPTQDARACEDPVNYSGAVLSGSNRIDDPIGTAPGRYFLCVIGVGSQQQRPSHALMNNAWSLPIEVLPAQVSQVSYSSERTTDGHVRIQWQHDQPNLKRYLIKFGPIEKLDCNLPMRYRPLMFDSHIILKSQLPLKLCGIAVDVDGKKSTPRSDILNALDD
ncbi:serine protease [Pseudomonas sp. F16(2018)]|uniref:trypsin-like serine peptidase n=1 Tax=Pseudomonas sp. F16(2018) TaxID=2093746 RepID=UPI00111989AC|nr:serine protease [Pseudomonas sp. F16(2018)]